MYGNRDELLKWCFRTERPLAPAALIRALCHSLDMKIPGLKEIEPQQAQWLYYRITGTPYNAVRPPDVRGLRGGTLGSSTSSNEFDFDQGGDAVAACIRGLSLERSRVNATVDTQSGTSYTEWTLVFKNDSTVQREARAQVALPPGGVVSRLTLWINEEEREAAYSERSRVREAYRRVVRRRRDPVLVTTSGRNRILVQCFPVPPQGGTMKTRIGITAPLAFESREEALLRLPFFIERNFSIPGKAGHPVRVEANARMAPVIAGSEMNCSSPSADRHLLLGSLRREEVTHPYTVRLTSLEAVGNAWTEDHRSAEGHIVSQTFVETPIRPPERAVIVIDGSRRMAGHKKRIEKFIVGLPDRLKCTILMAGDEVMEVRAVQDGGKSTRQKAALAVADAAFEGGCDNGPALKKALRTAAASDRVIVWLHSAQPVELSDTGTLTGEWNDRSAPILYRLQLEPGPNVLARKLDEIPAVKSVPSFGDVEDDLNRLFAILSGKATRLEFKRRRVLPEADARPGRHASSHLARLWAHTEVLRLAATGKEADRANAVKIAAAYQLVTPVSGAVVLETEKQYRESGLTPIDANSAPTVAVVPEPEAWALMTLGIAVMFLAQIRRKRPA